MEVHSSPKGIKMRGPSKNKEGRKKIKAARGGGAETELVLNKQERGPERRRTSRKILKATHGAMQVC